MEPQWYGTRPSLTRRLRVTLLFICSTAEAGRMRAFLAALILATGLALEFDVQAQTSNSVTATCKDGSMPLHVTARRSKKFHRRSIGAM